ncbi:MAG TPA: glycine cleavage T C-terminal barrel domain-containing protein [Dehalococcoidia bacterium]|jgi:folate-binding protein YgfZ|nr:glycine cleavage T C-terminal barrel domain-containing protein [Dehalococcoidia bacterium]
MSSPSRVYTDITSEYRAATEQAGLHNTSGLGRLKATGDDALDLLNRMSTNLVWGLEPGQGKPTVLTTDRGRILDLIGVVNVGDYVLLLTSPDQQQAIIDWLDKYTIMEDLKVADITSLTSMLTVLGPRSPAKLEEVLGIELSELPPYHTIPASLDGRSLHVINRPLGALSGFDLIASSEDMEGVWQRLVDSGVAPVGTEAYEAVRVQYAVPLYGQEMGDAYNPLEAGLIGSIDFHKGCYIGQEVIARLDTYQKVQKRLVRLRFSSGATVSPSAAVFQGGQEVGRVTSVASIPTTGETIGLGYVRTASLEVDSRLQLTDPAVGWAEIENLAQLFRPGEE